MNHYEDVLARFTMYATIKVNEKKLLVQEQINMIRNTVKTKKRAISGVRATRKHNVNDWV